MVVDRGPVVFTPLRVGNKGSVPYFCEEKENIKVTAKYFVMDTKSIKVINWNFCVEGVDKVICGVERK